MKRVKYTIANWKMNGLKDSIKIVKSIGNYIERTKYKKSEIVICPPYTLLSQFINSEKKIRFGGQDCHHYDNGAYTGSISAQMIKSIGCNYVIIGHSERREYNKETSNQLNLKIEAAIKNKLKVIYCIGEKKDQIKKRNSILNSQLASLPNNFDSKKIIIAYEPVWAIGTGKIPTLKEINNIHLSIRKMLLKKIGLNQIYKIAILYGGSVNSSNACDILNLDNVDGALVGGASLNAKEFCKIIDSYQ